VLPYQREDNEVNPNKDQAERVILEILRQSTNGLGRTKLYKAFWLAHLYYALENRGYLTDWPIVRMPNGPGVDKGPLLLQELAEAGLIRQEPEQCGPFREWRSRLMPNAALSELPQEAIAAVKKAIAFVEPKTTTELSAYSHDHSRSWWEAQEGEELNIYSDLIPDEEYDARKAELAAAKKEYESLFE
jgi:hypothetical protein